MAQARCPHACPRLRVASSLCVLGVEEVKCDVEAKTVVVKHTEAAKPEAMLEKLLVWSNASGKPVELVQG